MAKPAVEIRPGRNVWLFARTDRDAPSPTEVSTSAVALMSRILPDVVPGIVPFTAPGAPDGTDRYYLGAARPLDVTVSTIPARVPGGLARWRREDQEQAFAIKAEVPWYALVDFDWRGPTVKFEQWPRRKTNMFGFGVDEPLELDWLLLYAAHMGEATRKDSTWTDETVDRSKNIMLGAGVTVLIVAAAYFLGGGRRR
jgi:hypothetical protein